MVSHGPHDAPSVTELVEAVREWIARDVMTSETPALAFHGRVAANMLAMVERELELGPAHEAAHAERLAVLGVESDADLAAQIRAGGFDDRHDELIPALRAAVADKIAVANPTYT